MNEATWAQMDHAFARRLDNVLAAALDHDPVTADILPGGDLGNHAVDVELTGLRTATYSTAGDKLVIRCTGGSGWCIGATGNRDLYPRVGELVCHTPLDLIEPDEEATLEAWGDEGVPVRLRGLVGDSPLLVLDDGWRTVLLPRPKLAWSITPA